MKDVSPEPLQQRIQALEKNNRLLKKKLQRSESSRLELEDSYEAQSKLVGQVIQGLEQSRSEAESRSQQLQEAFNRLKLMQTKLVQSEKMSALGVLVAGIAHEINNPVSFIYGNIIHASTYAQNLVDILKCYQEIYPNPGRKITALSEELELDFIIEDLFKTLKSIHVGSERIHSIVLGLKTFSRFEQCDRKDTNLQEGLDSTLMLLQHRLKACGHRPSIQVHKDYHDLPQVSCYPGQINQVFMNILVNAIDAIEDCHAQSPQNQPVAGKITICTTMANPQWVTISIADNALGMPEAVRSQIFNPFFTTKPVGKGTGMGLSISYQLIVENHAGILECTSTLGKGTEFVIQIPLWPSSEEIEGTAE